MRRATAVLAVLVLASCTPAGPGARRPGTRSGSPTPRPVLCTVAPARTPPPDGAILVRGCVGTADGRPAHATVAVAHKAGILESLATAFAVTVSLGTCLLDPSCLREHDALAAQTDAGGQFQLAIPRGHDAATQGTDSVLIALPGDVVVETTFHVRGGTQDVSMQPVEAWQPGFSFTIGGTSARAGWTPLPSVPRPTATLNVRDARVVTYPIPVTLGTPFDARLLPPGTDQVWVSVDTRTATYRTPVRVVTVPGANLSRHARCVLTFRGKDHRTSEDGPCALTDGDWSTGGDAYYLCGDRLFTTADCLQRGWSARVDLGAAKALSDVVVVNAAGGAMTIEESLDRTRWDTLAAIPASHAMIVSTGPLAGVRARYLRVSGDVAGLAEVVAY
jgi:hypothetical protein